MDPRSSCRSGFGWLGFFFFVLTIFTSLRGNITPVWNPMPNIKLTVLTFSSSRSSGSNQEPCKVVLQAKALCGDTVLSFPVSPSFLVGVESFVFWSLYYLYVYRSTIPCSFFTHMGAHGSARRRDAVRCAPLPPVPPWSRSLSVSFLVLPFLLSLMNTTIILLAFLVRVFLPVSLLLFLKQKYSGGRRLRQRETSSNRNEHEVSTPPPPPAPAPPPPSPPPTFPVKYRGYVQ